MVDRAVIGAEIDLTVVAGRGLVAKDGGVFSKKSSDPYVKVVFVGSELGKTPTITKSLDPEWNHTMKFVLEGRRFRTDADLVLGLWDFDKTSGDDSMGEVRLRMADLLHGSVVDKWCGVTASPGCTKVSGELHVRVSVALRRALSIGAHEAVPISDSRIVRCPGLEWLSESLASNRKTTRVFGSPCDRPSASAGTCCRATRRSTSTRRACASTTRGA